MEFLLQRGGWHNGAAASILQHRTFVLMLFFQRNLPSDGDQNNRNVDCSREQNQLHSMQQRYESLKAAIEEAR